MRHIFTLFLCLALCVASPVAHARQSTQAAFSPSPEAVKLVERTIRKAEKIVDVAAYYFTSQKIADALISAHKRGVEVRVLLDKGQGKLHYRVVQSLHEAGIPIRINRKYAIMHNKYIIIDKKTVETESFNYTDSAEQRNTENVIVIKNNVTLAKRFMKDWDRLWSEGEEYP